MPRVPKPSRVVKPSQLSCPECGAPMIRRSSHYGMFYGCSNYPACKATHGAHPDGKPLGRPADKATRLARIRAHRAFDSLWIPRHIMTRDQAYDWLKEVMSVVEPEAHIGSFCKEQCDMLIDLARAKLHGWVDGLGRKAVG